MRILLVDHSDSYTQNLAHALYAVTGHMPEVVHSSALPEVVTHDLIVLSPGPGNVYERRDVGGSLDLLSRCSKPMLGICFGHQLIARAAGADVVKSLHQSHGYPVTITHQSDPLFRLIPSPFSAMQYHSWVVQPHAALEVLARSLHGDVMALRVGNRIGVQFHPESIASEHGLRLIANAVELLLETGPLPTPFTSDPAKPAVDDVVHPRHIVASKRIDPLLVFARLRERSPRSFFFDGRYRRSQLSYVGVLDETADPSSRPTPREGEDFPRLVGAYEFDPSQVELRIVRGCLAFDHRDEHVRILGEVPAWLVDLATEPLAPLVSSPPPQTTLSSSDSKTEYLAKIATVVGLIEAGEVYQLCLTRRVFGAVADNQTLDPVGLYLALSARAKPRYGAIIDFADRVLVGASPETLLELDRGVATTRPIKGTRRRGESPVEDRLLAQDLASAAKDRAENLMIVDVARHDLGLIAEPGTVRAEALLEVETLPTAHQLVSTLSAHTSAPAHRVLHALLPPASMTGAPKQRAVEHLSKLEHTPRGLYAGAYGWISQADNASFAVTIRSAVLSNAGVFAGTGGAILLGSDPEEEWAETELKTRALAQALHSAPSN